MVRSHWTLQCITILQILATQTVIPKSAVSASSPANLLDIQNLKSHPGSRKSESACQHDPQVIDMQSLRSTALDPSHTFYWFLNSNSQETTTSSGRIPQNPHTMRGERRKENSKLFSAPLPSVSLNIQ